MNADYERIARAIAFITAHAERQPVLEEIAAHIHLSPFHFQRLFARWVGTTPKRFLQVLTLERAKKLLGESASLLEASEQIGLSSSSRLYDHFVHLEAITPGEFKARGKGLAIEYGTHETPFGPAFFALTQRGICRLEFIDPAAPATPLSELAAHWPQASFTENPASTGAVARRVFNEPPAPDRPLSLNVSGTNFQISVWNALLRIPPGKLTTYARLATAAGHPGAARAVGRAVGMNPVAFAIPCHRVIQQTGGLGGYRWGTERKQAIHCWEAARYD